VINKLAAGITLRGGMHVPCHVVWRGRRGRKRKKIQPQHLSTLFVLADFTIDKNLNK